MTSLKQLNTNQLNKMIDETKAELKRRENIKQAHKDVQALLNKYGLTIQDLDFGVSSKKAAPKKATTRGRKGKKAPTKKTGAKRNNSNAMQKKDQRATVAPKYHNPETGDKWSGRGRAPTWVTKLCTAGSMSIEQFKADARFRI